VGDLIDLVGIQRERGIHRVLGEISQIYRHAGDIVVQYVDLMEKDVASGLRELPCFLDDVRNLGDRAYEGLAVAQIQIGLVL